MKRPVVLLLLLFAAMVPAGSASANDVAFGFSSVLGAMSSSIRVPPEWDGIWATQDSVLDCTTGFKQLSSGADTLCSGQVYDQTALGLPLTITCTGTADATTYHATCTGSMEIVANCQATYDIQTDGIRSGDTYRAVTTTTVSYSGTAFGCDLFPGSCTTVISHGTRTEPAPSVYCVTAAKQTSWGSLKAMYR
jgi:hypothetical protein